MGAVAQKFQLTEEHITRLLRLWRIGEFHRKTKKVNESRQQHEQGESTNKEVPND